MMYLMSFESIFKWRNVYININSVSDTDAVAYSMLTSESKQPRVLFEVHTIGFRGNKNIQSDANWPFRSHCTIAFSYIHIV